MIDITTLHNGLRVVNEYMDDVESVSVNIWVNTGNRNETKKNNGISHFLEHMAFKGTTSRNTQQIAEEFDDIGGRVNAFTSSSKTAYYTKVLKDNIEKAVELLADITQNSIFPEDEIEKERFVILQELAMTKDDPSDLIGDYFMETAYKDQPYGRSILGPVKNIKSFKKDDILNYIKSQYKTEDIIISFAGNLKNNEAIALVEKYFTLLNKGKNKQPEKAIYTGGYLAKNKKLEQTQFLMGFESCSYLDKHYYEVGVLSIVLGGGMSSRLFQEIREKRGLCYRINTDNSSSIDTGLFEIYCAVSPEKTDELIHAVIDELKKATHNITKDECDRAITKLKSNILMSKESNSNRAQKNASDLFARNKVVDSKELIQQIESVNAKKLQNYMEFMLSNSKPTINILGKIGNNISTYEDICNKIKK